MPNEPQRPVSQAAATPGVSRSTPAEHAASPSGTRPGQGIPASSIVTGLAIATVLSAAAGLMLDKDSPFALERFFAFYAATGLIAGLAFIAIARLVRPILSQAEDYYDR
ncbi:MAG: hypothetical protein ACFCUN_08115 [Hyphomicrobiaceae bacterium]